MIRPVILLVEDDEDLCGFYSAALRTMDVEVLSAYSAEQAREILKKRTIDLLLTDLDLPGASGLDLLEEVKKNDPRSVVTLITGKGTIHSALEAMKKGAFDFLLKPLAPVELRAHVQKALSHRGILLENQALRNQLERQRDRDRFVGTSTQVQQLKGMIDKVAPHPSTVLITGESGTGKELIARMLHEQSGRRDKPFVAINCSAVPETLLESELFGHRRGAFTGATEARRGVFALADSGTLMLDEIGTMPVGLQAKLLRVIEDGRVKPVGAEEEIPVDVRLIAATNADLEVQIAQGQFREDLYFRLNVIRIAVPPLRERPEDIPVLAQHFVDRIASGKRMSEDFVARLNAYSWPGNARELSNVIERACLLADSDVLDVDLLPKELIEAPKMRPKAKSEDAIQTLQDLEQQHIARVLEQTAGQRSEAARLLGISRRTLYNKLRQYGLGE